MSRQTARKRVLSAFVAFSLCFCASVHTHADFDSGGRLRSGNTTLWQSTVTMHSSQDQYEKENSTTVELRSNIEKGDVLHSGDAIELTATVKGSNRSAEYDQAIWYLDGEEVLREALDGSGVSKLIFEYRDELEASVVVTGTVDVMSGFGYTEQGSFVTDLATLTFKSDTSFRWLSQPTDTYVNEGAAPVVFYAVASSDTELSYQWYWKAGNEMPATALAGETELSISVESSAENSNQSWYCVVTDRTGERHISRLATLTVYEAPKLSDISVTGFNISKDGVYYLPIGSDVAFRVDAGGGYPDVSQVVWQVSANNGISWRVAMVGNEIVLTGNQMIDRYRYRAIATNTQMESVSSEIPIRIATEPSVRIAPDTAGMMEAGKEITFTAQAKRGSGPNEELSYAWFLSDTEDLEQATRLDSGGKSYYKYEASLADNGRFMICRVWNGAMTAQSAAYRLDIEPVPPSFRVSGMPDTWVKEPISLTIESTTENASELAAVPYSWDGGGSWTENATKVFRENGEYVVQVRDIDGRVSSQRVLISCIDTDAPETGDLYSTNESWTNRPVCIRLTDVSDEGSGLAAAPFNWNGTGWQTSTEYIASENGTVELVVRDKVENQTEPMTITVSNIDTEEPSILSIDGLATEWTNQPIDVLVTVEDALSGLPAEAYSWDGGVTWTPAPFATFRETGTARFCVRDVAGNITYHPFTIDNVDAVVPELAAVYDQMSNDKTSVLVKLYATDNEPMPVTEYCFGYDAELGAENEFTTQSERVIAIGETITVAARDWLGNTTVLELSPTYEEVQAELPQENLINASTAPFSGWTFGALNTQDSGSYLDEVGVAHAYEEYEVAGKTVRGVIGQIEARPLHGGWLSGVVTIAGSEYPIYWDNQMTQLATDTQTTGVFVIPAAAFTTSAKTAILTVAVTEYAEEALVNELGRDSVSSVVSIDSAAPTIVLRYTAQDKTVRASVTDGISGVREVMYRVTTDAGESAWQEYRDGIVLDSTSKVTVAASDRVGNVAYAASDTITIVKAIDPESEGYANSYRYRSALFEHYLIGTGKIPLSKAGK